MLATTSNEHFLREVDLLNSFSNTMHVPRLNSVEQIMTVVDETSSFTDSERHQLRMKLQKNERYVFWLRYS